MENMHAIRLDLCQTCIQWTRQSTSPRTGLMSFNAWEHSSQPLATAADLDNLIDALILWHVQLVFLGHLRTDKPGNAISTGKLTAFGDLEPE